MVVLKGITWDHDRGFSPLVYTSRCFSAEHPEIRITWRKRSLRDFGDYPIEKLIDDYDLLLIDHPFVGEACEKGLLLDLNEYMSPEELTVRAGQEMGHSYRCYNYNGKQLALGVDSAALVSAAREDLLNEAGLTRPEDFDRLIELAGKLPAGKSIAIPLCPTDAWCIFLSLAAAEKGQGLIDGSGISADGALASLRRLAMLRDIADPRSIDWNPVQVLDRMAGSDEIVYVPYCFGYVNYAWLDRPNPISFGDSPLWSGAQTATVMGGVGIAVSSVCGHKAEAVEYVRYVTDPNIQKSTYLFSGGQPGQLDAWTSEYCNRLTGQFFLNTLSTMERAYMRPRVPGWNVFQEQGGVIVNDYLRGRYTAEETADKINSLFRQNFARLNGVNWS